MTCLFTKKTGGKGVKFQNVCFKGLTLKFFIHFLSLRNPLRHQTYQGKKNGKGQEILHRRFQAH